MLGHGTKQVWDRTDGVGGGHGRKGVSGALPCVGVEAGSGTGAGETDRGGGWGVNGGACRGRGAVGVGVGACGLDEMGCGGSCG